MAILDRENAKPADTIRVKAELKIKAEELRRKLDAFPFAKAEGGTEKGTVVKYRILKQGKAKSDSMLLECAKDAVTLSFYHDEKSRPGKTLNLLRFMSLLAYLKDCYDVSLGELYGPIVESISYAAVIGYKPYIEVDNGKISDLLDSLAKSNLALSNKAIELEKSLNGTRDEILTYRRFSKEVLDRFSMKGRDDRPSADMLGIDAGLMKRIVELLSKQQKGD